MKMTAPLPELDAGGRQIRVDEDVAGQLRGIDRGDDGLGATADIILRVNA